MIHCNGIHILLSYFYSLSARCDSLLTTLSLKIASSQVLKSRICFVMSCGGRLHFLDHIKGLLIRSDWQVASDCSCFISSITRS
uniref:Secreted protein n=1 Tax=Pyxicephalus adspersus TaxID=30357 RepID=A0AAV3AFR0_PYXAD|nr:TPA: hypothetical protein GDO54_011876 [Pyxicephalus adspersus]